MYHQIASEFIALMGDGLTSVNGVLQHADAIRDLADKAKWTKLYSHLDGAERNNGIIDSLPVDDRLYHFLKFIKSKTEGCTHPEEQVVILVLALPPLSRLIDQHLDTIGAEQDAHTLH